MSESLSPQGILIALPCSQFSNAHGLRPVSHFQTRCKERLSDAPRSTLSTAGQIELSGFKLGSHASIAGAGKLQKFQKVVGAYLVLCPAECCCGYCNERQRDPRLVLAQNNSSWLSSCSLRVSGSKDGCRLKRAGIELVAARRMASHIGQLRSLEFKDLTKGVAAYS
eukprot:6465538-Amphidinium_carterae.1